MKTVCAKHSISDATRHAFRALGLTRSGLLPLLTGERAESPYPQRVDRELEASSVWLPEDHEVPSEGWL